MKNNSQIYSMTVCNKDSCSGCFACVESCPKDAINIIDTLDSYNAVIDENKCIKCGLCYKLCQNNNPIKGKTPILWKQGWSLDSELRAQSSSGGAAQAIELAFVKRGGVVCSCSFEEGEFNFSFSNSEDGIKRFSGSKYVKSSPNGVYKKIKELLASGIKVLFVGLPCQVSAIKKFTNGINDSNLYTIDLICHGTPSPQLLKIFLKQNGINLATLSNISFREKNKFQIKNNMKYVGTKGVADKYTIAFLNSISYTDNCYSCKYANLERVSDITLGDSWGTQIDLYEQVKGISLILCQTLKGRELVENANLHLLDVDLNIAIEHNHQLMHPSPMPSKRRFFFKSIKNGKSFNSVVRKCYIIQTLKQIIKCCLIKIKLYKN
jgi:coenzyme F420-reducing hydrogenase beta subunit